MQVSPSVRAVQVPETNPMHPQFTTIYLVGRGQVLTIDSGPDEERYRWMLRGYLAATEKAEIAHCALTHYHSDHSANLRWICDEFEAEAIVSRATAERIPDRLPQRVQQFDDGHEIDLERAPRLRVISTPGHSPDSVCFYLEDEGVLFTGDTVLGASTTAVQDLGAYLDSLRRLRDLPNLRVICPGHGPIIHDPVAYIDGYIRHREQREREILAALADGGALTSWEIMERLYAHIDPRLRRLADANVRTHLAKLAQEGRLRVHPGKRRPRSPQDEARARAEEQERDEVLRRAEEYREQARRRALFLQENPPTEEWLEPPRYEIAPD
ncbi:MAG TPA: MBL fold metallo-hydrolase [Dehalococcoidia bacterium]|nr:MBL fold metallo-hydrolase [Dehalococcoidia bacterium]